MEKSLQGLCFFYLRSSSFSLAVIPSNNSKNWDLALINLMFLPAKIFAKWWCPRRKDEQSYRSRQHLPWPGQGFFDWCDFPTFHCTSVIAPYLPTHWLSATVFPWAPCTSSPDPKFDICRKVFLKSCFHQPMFLPRASSLASWCPPTPLLRAPAKPSPWPPALSGL